MSKCKSTIKQLDRQLGEKKSGDVISLFSEHSLATKRDVSTVESFIIVFCSHLNDPFLLENYSN